MPGERDFIFYSHIIGDAKRDAINTIQATLSRALEQHQPLFRAWVSTSEGRILVPKVGARVETHQPDSKQLYVLPGGLYRMGWFRDTDPILGYIPAADWGDKNPAPPIDYFANGQLALNTIRKIAKLQENGGLDKYNPSPFPV